MWKASRRKLVQERQEVILRMLQNIGTTEIVVVALVMLVMFGGKKLPELARGIGDSIREFRKAASETA